MLLISQAVNDSSHLRAQTPSGSSLARSQSPHIRSTPCRHRQILGILMMMMRSSRSTSRKFTVFDFTVFPFITVAHSSPSSVLPPGWLLSIADLISPIMDPEHPYTLGSLSVVNLPDIHITPLARTPSLSVVTVLITPTITHCSLATVIGLGVRVRLEQALPPRFRVDVKIKEGTHSTGEAVTRQLSDKERVAAALENETLVRMMRKMLEGCH